MTKTGWKSDLVFTAAHPRCVHVLRRLQPMTVFLGALTLFCVVPVWAQTPAASSASATATTELPPVLPSASAPAHGAATNPADPSLTASPALGHSLQAPAPTGSTPAPESDAWQSLSKRQKQALAPLAQEWHTLTAQQRQKWLVLSRNFAQLSDEEQMTLHSRMREWAALSPRQRSQARFHFNTTQTMSAQDKQAQWEAYQALSEQEKSKLSSGPKPPVKSAARSFAPPSSRLVSPPLLPVNASRAVQKVAPSKPIHPKTLLPQPT